VSVASPPLRGAITNAIEFFERPYSREPYALLMLDVMYRQFGIGAFADALQRYDKELASRPKWARMLRVFRRISDHESELQPGDLEAAAKELDVLTVPALYCDRFPLPDDYPAVIEQAVGQGFYELTHALLAWIWIRDNECSLQLPEEFNAALFQATADLINDDPVATDLELEAAAFLHMAGQGAYVDDTFVERVIAQQNHEGGWLEQKGYYWHTSVSGLLFLLHVGCPTDSVPPMLAPPPNAK